jgi:hypothetical protein
MLGLVLDRHYRGNVSTIANQRVTISDLFAVHARTLRLVIGHERNTQVNSSSRAVEELKVQFE